MPGRRSKRACWFCSEQNKKHKEKWSNGNLTIGTGRISGVGCLASSHLALTTGHTHSSSHGILPAFVFLASTAPEPT